MVWFALCLALLALLGLAQVFRHDILRVRTKHSGRWSPPPEEELHRIAEALVEARTEWPAVLCRSLPGICNLLFARSTGGAGWEQIARHEAEAAVALPDAFRGEIFESLVRRWIAVFAGGQLDHVDLWLDHDAGPVDRGQPALLIGTLFVIDSVAERGDDPPLLIGVAVREADERISTISADQWISRWRRGLSMNLSYLRWRRRQIPRLQAQRSRPGRARQLAKREEGRGFAAVFSGAAHDLRTPLAAVSLALESHLAEESSIPPERIHRLRELLTPIEQLAADFQLFAEEGRAPAPRRQSFCVRTLLNDCVAALSPALHRRGLALLLSDSTPQIHCESEAEVVRSIVLGVCLALSRSAAGAGSLRLTLRQRSGLALIGFADSRKKEQWAQNSLSLADWNIGPHGGGWGISLSAARRRASAIGARLIAAGPSSAECFLLVLPFALAHGRARADERHPPEKLHRPPLR